jgi:hypothetical protein
MGSERLSQFTGKADNCLILLLPTLIDPASIFLSLLRFKAQGGQKTGTGREILLQTIEKTEKPSTCQ